MFHRRVWAAVRAIACAAALALPARAGSGVPAFTHGSVVLGDYDAEPRRADGRVDAPALAARLRALGANTYCWLVWHRASDWEDLGTFLPLADRDGIDVWVYLVPPSECPPHTARYPEPWRLDYGRWAEEIARRSLRFPRLKGWVIDDFTRNLDVFTPGYVAQLQGRAHRINPGLALLALAYFPHLREPFVADYGGLVDGVVAAYPADPDEIRWARALLGGGPSPGPAELRYPWRTRSESGDFVAASRLARIAPDSVATLSFRERDDFAGALAGHHRKQVLVDGVVVWDEDVAGGGPGWHEVTLAIPSPPGSPRDVEVTFRLLAARRVDNFGVRWWIDGVRGQRLGWRTGSAWPADWTTARRGEGSASFGQGSAPSDSARRLPLFVMTAATPAQDELRYGAPSSRARILQHVDECLRAAGAGLCDGIVTYCLDKSASSASFDSVRVRYRAATGR